MQPEPAAGAPVLRLAIAPDAAVVVAGTAAMLSKAAPEIDVVCLSDTLDDPGRVDMLFYDPQKHALADLTPVRLASPEAMVVAYCWSIRSDIVDEARRNGASGFLSKELSAEEIVTAIRALRAGHHGRFVFLPYAPARASSAAPSRPHGLTERELDVLELITQGHTNDEIARRLFLSINSVKSYIRTGYRKIGATRRTQAMLWGVEQGLGPVGPRV
jgi:NarL family two-component system response regulator LiaR